jgi:NAD(P)-dependent dehydrogenase (short-subunit alcohol dehydrogenase family)
MSQGENEDHAPVVLVTGAEQGIGAAIAARMAADGYLVAVTANAELSAIESRLKELGAFAYSRVVDLTEPSQIRDVIGDVKRLTGRIDVLINNAGMTFERRLDESTDNDFDRCMAVNLKAPWIAAAACVPLMRRQGGGAIVNVSSIHAQLTMPAHSIYAASKGGLSALTRQLAVELAPDGIRVNGVEPGLIDVPRTRRAAAAAGLANSIPLGRPGWPDEVADVVAWLAGPRSGFVTGELIRVDGGASARMVLPPS